MPVAAQFERVVGGRYVAIDIDRMTAARFGLNIADVQEVVRTALGGMRVAQTVEGLERYPINIRFPRDVRDSLEKLRNLPILAPGGAHVPLAEVTGNRIDDGPGMIMAENARRYGWTYDDPAKTGPIAHQIPSGQAGARPPAPRPVAV